MSWFELEQKQKLQHNLRCGFCGSENQKVCWECCENTTSEIYGRIDALEKMVKSVEEKLAKLQADLELILESEKR